MIQCPDPDWSLWSNSDDLAEEAWCCNVNHFGVIIDGGRGLACSPFGSQLGSHEATASDGRDFESTCTSSSTSTSTESATSASATPDDDSDNAEEDDPPLAGGALAGIVVGSIAGFAVIMAAAWWTLRRRGIRARSSGEYKGVSDRALVERGGWQEVVPVELGGQQSHSPAEVGEPRGGQLEADSTAVYEMPGGKSSK